MTIFVPNGNFFFLIIFCNFITTKIKIKTKFKDFTPAPLATILATRRTGNKLSSKGGLIDQAYLRPHKAYPSGVIWWAGRYMT